MKNKNKSQFPPIIFNVFKPARMSSYDVVRHFKRNLPIGYGKIGHFGTLDPFAAGVLMIGIGGAARLNDFIHEYMPKTYIAIGKLGIETPTGDYTAEVSQRDDSLYLKKEIASFSAEFIEERARIKLLGEYWQAPHKYSAAKFMGKNLHEWAREGVDVKKEQVKRHVHSIEVIKFAFPYLSLRVTVSSGTYVRTLFSDLCHELGTIGHLVGLVRESVGGVCSSKSLRLRDWPVERQFDVLGKGLRVQDVLDFPRLVLTEKQGAAFRNGAFLKWEEFARPHSSSVYFWMQDSEEQILGLAQDIEGSYLKPKINFHSVEQAETSSGRGPQ